MDIIFNKSDYCSALLDSIKHTSEGYWITLNGISNDEARFNQCLQELANRLNIFCFGNQYRASHKKFEIRGALQHGNIYGRLHAHIVAMKNGQTKRTDSEIEYFIRKHWYRLIGASGNVFGSLVDFQSASDVASRIRYAVRDFHPKFDQRNQLIYL
jgi:hypothetical protein